MSSSAIPRPKLGAVAIAQMWSMLTLVPISRRPRAPISMIPSIPTRSSIARIHSGCMNQQFMIPIASYSWRGISPDSPSVAREASAFHSFHV